MSQKPVMRVRPAIEEEGSALSAIAYAAKAHWGYPASVLAAWAPDLTISAESVARHPTFVCEVEGLLAGFYQLVLSEGACELEHLWVHPAFMRRGVGRQLLAHAVEHASRCGVPYVSIDSDPNAEKFYLACGAVRTGAIAAPIEGDPTRTRPQLRISTEITQISRDASDS